MLKLGQDEPLSSTIFNIYINDFLSFVNEHKTINVNTDSVKIRGLLFVEDIVLIVKYKLQRINRAMHGVDYAILLLIQIHLIIKLNQ